MRQQGRCPECTQKLEVKGGRVVCVDEHLEPLWRKGTNELKNRELWCKLCSSIKTAVETTERTDGYRVRDKFIGALKSLRPMPGSRASGWKHRMNGMWERR